ncbi:hypothetical protein [Nocardioides sp. YIM 152588]|uniref:hypothetical protein n=1 Tax=Nocardioides sp. YIM 152588 TaxID=3158259 RepID=UPI0032E4B97E
MYGENAGAIRDELGSLLRQHRIQFRIGGMGIIGHRATTTVQEREAASLLIQRYRFALLIWCRHALAAADPGHTAGPGGRVYPEVELARRLRVTIDRARCGLPSLDELVTPQPFPLVEAWRRMAKASVLGEHDFAGDMADGRLDIDERLTVVKDVAEVIRALLVLDVRYVETPGWDPLRGPVRLANAAETCAFLTAEDYRVDWRGWRPAPAVDHRPLPGIAGVIQSERNMFIHLGRFPDALHLRLVLDSQRDLSRLLADRLGPESEDVARAWNGRARTYDALHRESRHLGGLVGGGGHAVGEAATALSRVRQLPPGAPITASAQRDLVRLFAAVDRRVADILEQGAREKLYFVGTPLSRIVEVDGRMTHRARPRYWPITAEVETELLRMVRDDLRPPPEARPVPPGAANSRDTLRAAMNHRPRTGGPERSL